MKLHCDSIYSIGKAGLWDDGLSFTNITLDSRTVTTGSLFAAHKGEKTDAHVYIDQAVGNGATAVVAEYMPEDLHVSVPVLLTDDVPRTLLGLCTELRKLHPEQLIVAVTGSNGKTTTKDILASVLSGLGTLGATEGNLNTEWGVPQTFINNYEKDILVIEMGMDHPGDIAKLASAVMPDAGVVTTVAPVHMEFMKTIDAVYIGKTELFTYVKKNGLKLANGDNELLKRTVIDHVGSELFGQSNECRYNFKILQENVDSTTFLFDGYTFILPIWGSFNVYNAVPAIIIAHENGMSYDEIQKRLMTVSLSPKRMELHRVGVKILINDTYNASPNAVIAALQSMSVYSGKKIAICLGDMLELGNESKAYHRTVCSAALQVPNSMIFCVGQEFYALHHEFPGISFFTTKEACIETMNRMTGIDVYFFKGSRGMRMEEVFAAIKETITCSTIL